MCVASSRLFLFLSVVRFGSCRKPCRLWLIPCLFSAGLIKDERAFVPMLFCVPALFFDRAPCRVAGLFPGLSGNAAYGTFPDFGTILPRRLYAGPFGVAAPEEPCHGGRRGYFWSSSGGLIGLLFLLFCYRRQQHAWKREGRDLTLKEPISVPFYPP